MEPRETLAIVGKCDCATSLFLLQQVELNPPMLCLDSKISFQILNLDEIYCLDGMKFEIIEFD